MAYIGNTAQTQNFIPGTDYFNGNGSTVNFTLSRAVGTVNDIEVFVNNVAQRPTDSYTVSGNLLTMNAAPSAGTNNVYVRYLTTQLIYNNIYAAKGDVFYENSNTISASYTITTGKNALTAGPVTVADGVTVTVPDGSVWAVM
jgi:hypothetical protein